MLRTSSSLLSGLIEHQIKSIYFATSQRQSPLRVSHLTTAAIPAELVRRHWSTAEDASRQEQTFKNEAKRLQKQHFFNGLHPDMRFFIHDAKPWGEGTRMQFYSWLFLRDEWKGDLTNPAVVVLVPKMLQLGDKKLLARFWVEYDRRALPQDVKVENLRMRSLVVQGAFDKALALAEALKSSGHYNDHFRAVLIDAMVSRIATLQQQDTSSNKSNSSSPHSAADAADSTASADSAASIASVSQQIEATFEEARAGWRSSGAAPDSVLCSLLVKHHAQLRQLQRAEEVKQGCPGISQAAYRYLIEAHWQQARDHARAHQLFEEYRATGGYIGKSLWTAIAPVWEHMRENNISP